MFTELKDSGVREYFSSGAQRDTEIGKGAFDLMSPFEMIRRMRHMQKGAEKYTPWNWAKGIRFRRLYSSMMRHAYLYLLGDRSEDHLAAVCFNAGAMIHFEELEAANPGTYSYLFDLPKFPNPENYMALWTATVQEELAAKGNTPKKGDKHENSTDAGQDRSPNAGAGEVHDWRAGPAGHCPAADALRGGD